ncbi:hypothetical protein EQ500_10145, partial [Lactobacillus sp. XV13L]|nr:hypothetical protein [Lactobacillus sp. XV13L]
LWTARTTTAVISELQGAFPNFQFEIQHLFTSNESLKMLENHNVDVFWGALLHGPEFNSRYLYRSRASIIIPRNHALFQKGRRKVAFSPALFHQLNNSALVSLTDNSVFQKIADHLFADDGIRVHKTIKVNDFIGACQLAIKGLGITVTLNDTLDYLNASRYEFNVMEIPRTMFNLDVGVTTNRSASPQVNEVAQKLCRVVNSANKKL